MQQTLYINRIKIVTIGLIAIAGTFVHASGFTAADRFQVDISGRGASMAERVGPDDGALFSVHFGGDTHGSLDSCG